MISVSFGCPYEGRVEPERVFAIARRLVAAGAQEIGFGDTTGMANPVQVRSFFPAARAAIDPAVELTAHFHNTRGQGLANVLAALEAGCESFESSFGEIGGCPSRPERPGTSPPRTSSRCCTRWESRRASTSTACSRRRGSSPRPLGRPLGSHTLLAGPVDGPDRPDPRAPRGPVLRVTRERNKTPWRQPTAAIAIVALLLAASRGGYVTASAPAQRRPPTAVLARPRRGGASAARSETTATRRSVSGDRTAA